MNNNIVPQLLPIEKSNETVRNTILTNVVKMITERKLLNKNNIEANIQKILSVHPDDMLYKIQLDTKIDNHNTMMIKLLPQNITSTSKISPIMEFFNQHKNIPKIVIVEKISYKTIYNIKNDAMYPNTEIFMEKELMINIIEHTSQPEFYLLSDEEKQMVLKEYQAKQREIPEMKVTDPVAKYYNAKIFQMFRILRPSETSGLVPYYRLVVRGDINDYV